MTSPPTQSTKSYPLLFIISNGKPRSSSGVQYKLYNGSNLNAKRFSLNFDVPQLWRSPLSHGERRAAERANRAELEFSIFRAVRVREFL